MLILVSNDDGVHAPGLASLAAALEPLGRVVVVAPDRERSAVGHAVTLHRPLRIQRLREDWYSVDGTPTDCVHLGIHGILRGKPDLLVSGLNQGGNLGDDITYSGTVSAAMEAVIHSCPAFAISQEYVEEPDYALAALAATVVARNILEHGLAPPSRSPTPVPGRSGSPWRWGPAAWP